MEEEKKSISEKKHVIEVFRYSNCLLLSIDGFISHVYPGYPVDEIVGDNVILRVSNFTEPCSC